MTGPIDSTSAAVAQYATFGASGALVAPLLGGLVLAFGSAETNSSPTPHAHRLLSEAR